MKERLNKYKWHIFCAALGFIGGGFVTQLSFAGVQTVGQVITCTADLGVVNADLVVILGAFLLGAIIASLIWWYLVRKYDGDLDTKVRETADKVADGLKDSLQSWLKDEIAKAKDKAS